MLLVLHWHWQSVVGAIAVCALHRIVYMTLCLGGGLGAGERGAIASFPWVAVLVIQPSQLKQLERLALECMLGDVAPCSVHILDIIFAQPSL